MERVALFAPSLRGGGAERVIAHLASGFAARGLAVDLVLVKAEGPYLAQIPSTVRVIDLQAKRMLTSLPALVRYLRSTRPKALLAALDHTNITALWARKIARVSVRIVGSVRCMPSNPVHYAHHARARWIPLGMRLFYPWADALAAVSSGVADDVARITGINRQQIKVIYNPINAIELLAKAREPIDHPWFQDADIPVIMGVGRLNEAKDFPSLIRAFALLRATRKARLMILGEGEDRFKLEQLIKELGLTHDVALMGFIDNPYKYLQRAALFVLSSRSEGLPNVLIEVLVLGVPVVSTHCHSGPAEILGESSEWLVPVGDVTALAAKMAARLKQHEPPNVDLKRFTLDTVVDQYLDVLGIQGNAA